MAGCDISDTSHCCDQSADKCILRKQRFTLVHSLKGYIPSG